MEAIVYIYQMLKTVFDHIFKHLKFLESILLCGQTQSFVSDKNYL